MAPVTRSQDDTPAFSKVTGMLLSGASTDMRQEHPDEDMGSEHEDGKLFSFEIVHHD